MCVSDCSHTTIEIFIVNIYNDFAVCMRAEGNLRFRFRCLQYVGLPLTSYSFVLIALTAVGRCECIYRTFDIKSYTIKKESVPMSRRLYWILGELLRPHLLWYQCQERCLYALYLADKVWMCKSADVACRAPCFYCIYACTYGQRFSFLHAGVHVNSFNFGLRILSWFITEARELCSVPLTWGGGLCRRLRVRWQFWRGVAKLAINQINQT